MIADAGGRAVAFRVAPGYPADCAFCAAVGADPSRVVEVQASSGVDWLDEQVTASGRLEVVRDDLDGLVYRLHEAWLAE